MPIGLGGELFGRPIVWKTSCVLTVTRPAAPACRNDYCGHRHRILRYYSTYAPCRRIRTAEPSGGQSRCSCNASGPSHDYIYGPSGTPVEQVNLLTSTPTYMTYTASDSTWLTTNATGAETGFWGYDAFGNLAFGTPMSPFGYSGQYTDASTGLVNDRARFYEPQTGGFATRDPAFASTDTAYTYSGGDPVNGSDPSGDCTSGVWWCDIAHTIGHAATNIHHAYNCLLSACYTTKTGAANAVAGAHNSFNYVSGLPPVPAPYPCSNSDAYPLGGQLFYGGLLLLPGAGEAGAAADAGGAAGSAAEAGGGSLSVVGDGFSASEQSVARVLADQGNEVILRQATGAGPMSDLLVNGTPYDVYSPTTGSVDRIVSAVASKGPQVAGGGVVIDLSGSSLMTADLGNILARVQGITSQISDIIVVK